MSRLMLLHIRSLVVLLAVMLPILGLMVYTNLEARRQSIAEASADELSLARLAADQQSSAIQSSRQFLLTLSEVPEIQGNDAEACTALLDRLLRQYPLYRTLSVARANGDLFCSAPRVPARLNFLGRESFREALQTHGFVIGDYELDPLSAQPGLVVAGPVEDTAGNVRAIISADINLMQLSQMASKASLPPDSATLVIDRQGTVLAHYPDPAKWVGQRPENAAIVKAILAQPNEGVTELAGLDGVQRLFAWVALPGAPGTTDNGGYVAVGIPSAVIYGPPDETLGRNLALLLAATLLSFMIAWEANDRLIVRTMNRLLQATEQLSAGDFSARLGVPRQLGDWSGVANTFNQMAQSLQARDHDLRSAEQNYQTLVEHMPIGCIVRNADFRFQYWNSAAERIFGYETAEVIGRYATEFITPPEVQPRVQDILQQAAQGDMTIHVTNANVTKDGRQIVCEWWNTPLRDPKGQVVGLLSMVQDVTERQRAQEEIAYQAYLLANVTDAVIGVDSDCKISFWNRAAERMHGQAQGEVLGRKLMDLVRPMLSESQLNEIAQEVRAKGHMTGQLIYQGNDGTPLQVEWNAMALRNLTGEITGYVTVNRDITIQKRAEEEIRQLNTELEQRVADRTARLLEREAALMQANVDLQQEEEKLRTLIDSIADEVWFCDARRETILLNPTALRSLGLEESKGQSLGQVLARLQVLYPDGRPRPVEDAPLLHSLRGETVKGEEIVMDPMTGEMHFRHYSSAPTRDHLGHITGAVAVITDMTERKRAEDEIARLNESLEQRALELENTNRELDAFAYSVSHDLRTPLASIDSFSRLVAEDYAGQLAPEAERFVQLIRENAASMTRLIQDLLLFSRATRQPLKKQTVVLTELVKQALQDLDAMMQGRQVETVVEELPPCQADPILLKQVVINLLSNALKFTMTRDVTKIRIGCLTGRREPVYFVKDNGVGFDMKRADKLFGVFQRLHREDEYEGTGVGLAIVERIVHRHGGRVWAEAEEDKGATFYFTLP